MKKIIVSLFMLVGVSCLLVAEESSSRFVLETHSVNAGRGETPITVKLDTTTGDIWRYSGADFVQIPVAGTWFSGPHIEKEKEKQRQREVIIKKMQDIMIPKIEFRQANISDVVDFLVGASKDFGSDQKGINIILNLGSIHGGSDSSDDPFADAAVSDYTSGVPLITFEARQISLLEAVKIVTKVSNCQYRIEDGVIMIEPWDCHWGEVICRMYDLLPSTVERINTLCKELSGTNALAFLNQVNLESLFFEGRGGNMEGASMKLFPLTGEIRVCNTVRNLEIFENILKELNYYPPRPGRFRLLNIKLKSIPALLIIDSDTGNTWKYEVAEFDAVKREIVTDKFLSIPVRVQEKE